MTAVQVSITHTYTSTACQHGLHTRCGTLQHDAGDLGAPHCKFCDAKCNCQCHTSPRSTLSHAAKILRRCVVEFEKENGGAQWECEIDNALGGSMGHLAAVFSPLAGIALAEAFEHAAKLSDNASIVVVAKAIVDSYEKLRNQS